MGLHKNFLEETLEAIEDAGYTPEKVSYVGSRDGNYQTTWEKFAEIAEDTVYSDYYGMPVVAQDLVIVFQDSTWLERREYDSQYWWEHAAKPAMVLNAKELLRIAPEDEGDTDWYPVSFLNGGE